MLVSKARQDLENLAFSLFKRLDPAPITVGLSGGSDSTLVLLIACKLRELNPQFKITACHCIHGLDADDPIWLNHCQKLCQKLSVNLITPKLNIIYGNGVSPEDASRKERYAALLSNLSNPGYLFLGHQADDQVENFLLALKRGSGPQGLSGMRLITKDNRGTIVRPLLDLTKDTIEEMLKALGFDWVFDISNTYLKFERNFIRLKVLPLLRERFVGIDKAILKSASLCAFEHDLATRYATSFYNEAVSLNTLNIDKLPLHDEALSLFILRMFLTPFSEIMPDFNTVKACFDLALSSNDQKGVISCDGREIRRYLNKLYVVYEAKLPNLQQINLEIEKTLILGDFSYTLKQGNVLHKSFFMQDSFVTLDFDYKGSLAIKPQTRAHRREIKKIFGEYKIPYWYRKAYPLIRADNELKALGSLCALDECKKENKIGQSFYLEIKNLKDNVLI